MYGSIWPNFLRVLRIFWFKATQSRLRRTRKWKMRRKVAVRCVNVVWRPPGLSLGIRSAHSTQANPGALTPRQSKSLDEATLFDEGLFRHKDIDVH